MRALGCAVCWAVQESSGRRNVREEGTVGQDFVLHHSKVSLSLVPVMSAGQGRDAK